jgi:hypothetical protein
LGQERVTGLESETTIDQKQEITETKKLGINPISQEGRVKNSRPTRRRAPDENDQNSDDSEKENKPRCYDSEERRRKNGK